MDNVREKLVGLLTGCGICFHCLPSGIHEEQEKCRIADYLLANGVTVQEWIPVSEPPEWDGRFFVARYDSVTKIPFTDILWFERGQWWNRLHGGNFAVTHWMPMPPLPKGE